ncbi:arsenic transporter [Virgibacillus senegalensis]|uniref:arsenic transporter n=1 Tax=Virgibacillus senegalensis TaxID=1499679 RepID=UPI00069F0619|nr:arsenic transporter [Virgibacillus senegalensis]
MYENATVITILIFSLTIFFMLWKPRGLNETVPTSIGAMMLLVIGIVPYHDILDIFNMVSGASFTILSTIVMTIILDSVGFFQWVAVNIIKKVNGSGRRLFFYIATLCFLATMFFNNDGSILITTPIIIRIVTLLNLKPHEKIPYLITGALVATSASAPIAVSNIANLIALKIVNLDLNSYVILMFVPSMIGIITLVSLLFFYFKNDIPVAIKTGYYQGGSSHPLSKDFTEIDWHMFVTCIVLVVGIRSSYFILTPLGISLEVISIGGAIILILLRYFRFGKGIKDIITKTPWHILLFAFSMYVIVFALKNVGLTEYLINLIQPLVVANDFNAILTMGTVLTILSNVVNNLPSVMIGTLTLTEMGLDINTLQVSYLATILGSDIGALLTPIGTLATLIWMYILRESNINVSWIQYFKVTIMVIPVTLIVSLVSLFLWTSWIPY